MLGVELNDRGVDVRVWAPERTRVEIVVEERNVVLDRVATGHFVGFVPGVRAGARYGFRIDGGDAIPDPASRFQPDGPMGLSQVIDPHFAWTDRAWRGLPADRHVLYEMHVGSFTRAGTWASAMASLPFLAELGVTTLEIMPVNEFGGTRNWGYDGVNFFAPTRNYGTPDDFRRFVNRAHELGLAVILDVVYNHFGPVGNTMYLWSSHYKREEPTDWGDGFDFDGEFSAGVRELVIENAAYWVREFHLDGLRLDALQAIVDASPSHVIAELVAAARAAAPDRTLFIVGEDEPQDVALFDHGLDALWNDDFHHTARVAATGLIEGYLHDYGGTPQELISALKHGFLYQGQLYPWQKQPRGTSTRGLARSRFVHFLENHDQAANIGLGERLATLVDPALLRALTAVLLLGPQLPMLFQGQETGSRRPWRFFVDHPDLREAIANGRAEFVRQFPRSATPELQAELLDPSDEAVFRACVLDESERTFASPAARLHRDLLALRRATTIEEFDGAVLSEHAFVVRFGPDRLMLVNLASTFHRASIPEPLVAPPPGKTWKLAWSSEDPSYGGHGTPPVFDGERLAIPARSAVVVEAV